MQWARKQTGFTIVELLIVIVVIAILAAITIVAYNGIQERARDTQRLTDLSNIEKAIRLYAADHNDQFPTEASGANGIIGEGAGLDALLADYMSVVPHDPLGPGNATYNYYYDGKHNCGGRGSQAVIFIRTLESPKDDNTPCTSWGSEGGSDGANAYHILLGATSDP
tara:strand:+ start:141 stop:641 length:501 start_codon:yes stop_codon:yes gene_type:complete